MFTTRHKISFSETDPGGIVFFAEFFNIAHIAYEAFFSSLSLERNYFLDQTYILPIVHASADFLSPLKFGDEIICEVNVGGIGETSFELLYSIYKNENLSARIITKHVSVLRNEFKKIRIPEELLVKLKANQN